jgi:Xaa-Pro aminopeptidase
MDIINFSQSEFNSRITKLQDLLIVNQISLCVICHSPDIYYYTGSSQPLYVLIPDKGQPLVLVRKALERAKTEILHIEVKFFTDSKELIETIKHFNISSAQKIGFTLDSVFYSTVVRWQKLLNNAEIVDLSWQMRLLRMVKSPAEIAIQKRAGAVMKNLPDLICANFRSGMTELEVSAIIENYFRLQGHELLIKCRKEGVDCIGVCSAGINSLSGTKFDGVCSGKGLSAAVPGGPSFDHIMENTPVLLDYGFNLNGYIVDISRMMSRKQPSNQVMQAYKAMVEVEKAVIEKIKPGAIWSDIYNYALQLANNLGYSSEFMGLGTEKVKFIGHGVGLELDEPPFLAPKMNYELSIGMVIAIEPKVSLPEIGVIGIEDTVVIGNSGCEYITICSDDFIIVD